MMCAMRTFQLVMKGGLTKMVEADTRRKQRGYLVFRVDGRIVFDVKSSEVVMLDELPPIESLGLAEAHAG